VYSHIKILKSRYVSKYLVSSEYVEIKL